MLWLLVVGLIGYML
ncbi:hypothetical protein [Deinococcus psychrotolerans]